MKLKTESIPVETGGVTDQGDFSIKNSAAAFSILSSGLYSNKYEAILRELGCNAYDSHVEAGFPDKPFTVHLPTTLNPIFSVRDYGVGLDHEQVMGLYTTYFASTKNDSNDFVGCMGLGSKSPFSYTKNFTITAIKDGTKGQYSAYIGDQGVPAIVQLATEETNEENGVEVAFAVEDRSDMRQFQHEAKKVYKWFQVRPEITGNAIDIPELKYAEMDIIPGTHMKDHSGWNHESVAIMGNVAYPIDVPDGEELPAGVRSLLHENSFVIRFEIGELAIAASREELGYDPQTIKSLTKKAQEILAAMEVYVVNKIKPAKTKWERNLLAAELMKSNENLFAPIVSNYLDKNKAKFVKGTKKQYSRLEIMVPVAELDKSVDDIKYAFKSIRKNYSDYTKTHLGAIKPLRQNKPKHLRPKVKPGSNTGYNPNDKWEVFGVDPTNTIIVFNDEKGNVLQRIRQAYTDADYKDLFEGFGQLFIFQGQNKNADKKAILKYVKTRFGNAPILLASQLPAPIAAHGTTGNERVTVQRFVTKRTGRYARDEHTFDTIYSKLKDITPTVEKGKKKTFLYLKLSHKSIMKPEGSGTWSATTMYDLLDNSDIAKITGIDIDCIYGVNKTSFKTITKDARWINFFDYVNQEFDKIDWKAARSETEHKIIGQQFNRSDYSLLKLSQNWLTTTARTKTAMGVMCKKWNTWRNNVPKKRKKGEEISYDMLIRVMQEFFPDKDFTKTEAKLDVSKIEKEYEKIFADVEKAYPMLRHLSLGNYYDAERDWKDAKGYIKLVDSAK